MSKELSPLEALKELYHEREYTYAESVNHKSKKWANDIKHYDNIGDCLSIIETVLKENQDIQSCFEDYGLSIKDIRKVCVSYKQREKHEKAIEIIKAKRVNVDNFLNHIRKDTNYKEYKRLCGLYKIMVFSDKELTKQEYDLLKGELL